MRFSLAVLRRRRGTSATVQNVAVDLREAIQAANVAPCLNPTCDEDCHWTSGAGRPPLFHSRGCRERYERDRARLVEELQVIEAALGSSDELSRSDRPYLRSEAARRRWLLERYRWEPGGGGSDEDGSAPSRTIKKSKEKPDRARDSLIGPVRSGGS